MIWSREGSFGPLEGGLVTRREFGPLEGRFGLLKEVLVRWNRDLVSGKEFWLA